MNNLKTQTEEQKKVKAQAFEKKVKNVYAGNEDNIISAGYVGKYPFYRMKGHIFSDYDLLKIKKLGCKLDGINFQAKTEYEEESIFVSLKK